MFSKHIIGQCIYLFGDRRFITPYNGTYRLPWTLWGRIAALWGRIAYALWGRIQFALTTGCMQAVVSGGDDDDPMHVVWHDHKG